MDFDLSWFLLGLPLVFGLGWLASRLDMRQLRIENRRAPKAYFKGLNFLLNEQQDQAIDAFIEAVQSDPDTSELHFALGNLFRRRGEYERAVRVHEHLLSRSDLNRADQHRAQYALGLDFLKAGLLDRAEVALRKLTDTPLQAQAYLALLVIFERSREWPQAAAVAAQLESLGQGSFVNRQAHYLCEQALKLAADGQALAAQEVLEKAKDTAPQCARPHIESARLQYRLGQTREAFVQLASLGNDAPQALPLVAMELAQWGSETLQSDKAREVLQTAYEKSPSIDLLDALVWLQNNTSRGGDSVARYLEHLAHEPSLVAASRWLEAQAWTQDGAQPLLQRALQKATKPLTRYRCAACGFESQQHFWQCPGCQAWDSYPPRRVEEL